MMEYKDIVSIIIPTWNTEAYVAKAIDSCLSQDYEAIEIIVVDDGSTDGTTQLVEKMVKQDSRIHLIRQEHVGVSKARNLGMNEARGKYILFLDSDDWLEDGVISEVVAWQQKYPSYLISTNVFFTSLNGDGTYNQQTTYIDEEKRILSRNEALLNTGNSQYHGSNVDKIFDLEVIRKYRIQFDTDIAIGEDGLFVFCYLLHVDGMVYVDRPCWNIFYREGSSTRSKFGEKQLTSLYALDRMLALLSEYPQSISDSIHELATKRALILYKRYIESDTPSNAYLVGTIRKYLRENKEYYFKTDISIYDRAKFYAALYIPFGIYRELFHIKERIINKK